MGDLISFVDPGVKSRYEKLLARTVPQARTKVELLRDFHAGRDGVLNKEEVKDFENLLNYMDTSNRDSFFSCSSSPQYDEHEIQAAWETIFGNEPMDEEFLQLVETIPHPYWRTLLLISFNFKEIFAQLPKTKLPIDPASLSSESLTTYEMIKECFLEDQELRKNLFNYLIQLSKVPGFDYKQFMRFVKFIGEQAKKHDYFLRKRGSNAIKPEYSTYTPASLRKKFRKAIEMNAQLNVEQITYELKFEKNLTQPKQDYENIISLLQHPNSFVKQQVMFILGSNQMRPDLILATIDQESQNSIVIRSGFEALSYFRDEAVARELFERLGKVSFEASLAIKQSLVNYANPLAAINVMLEYLKHPDFFLRGQAASLLKYFVPESYPEKVRKKAQRVLKQTVLNSKEEPLVRLAAKMSLKVWNGAQPPAKVEFHWQYFQTGFFRYPVQVKWVANKLKELAQKKRNISILLIGGSTGQEAITLAIAVLEDYEAHPKEWGNFNPYHHLKIYSTDLDFDVLLYLKRGYYISTTYAELDDFEGLRWHALMQDEDLERYQDKYFVKLSERVYRVKSTISRMIRLQILDILNPQKQEKADFVLYNNVDCWLPDDVARIQAAENVTQLSTRYILTTSTVDSSFEITLKEIEKHALPLETIGPHVFLRKSK